MIDQGSLLLSAAATTPTYTIGRAAHYSGLPPATLRSWVMGRPYAAGGGERKSEPLIVPEDRETPLLSFTNIVEAHVLASVRKIHRVKMWRVRAALDYVQNRMGLERPLVAAAFKTNGVDLFVDLIPIAARDERRRRDVLRFK